MFFTNAGRIVAWLAIIFGGLRLGMGLGFSTSDNWQALGARYLGSSTGEAIDEGLMMLLFGIGFGVLTEISRSLQR